MSKGTYMGMKLEDMSKQELVDAVEHLGKLLEESNVNHSEVLNKMKVWC